MKQTYIEPSREIPIWHTTDVLVAGAGPSGVAAAIAAARHGARVTLIERSGIPGGLATGGLILNMIETNRYGRGICAEVIQRLQELKATRVNPEPVVDSPDWTEGAALSGEAVVDFDPEQLKLVLEQMLVEAGVYILLYTLMVDTIVEGNRLTGVVVECKQGRRAILAGVVIDATGDGDILAAAGEAFQVDQHPWGIDLGFRFGGVDVHRAITWRDEDSHRYAALMEKIKTEIGNFHWETTNREDVVCGDGGRLPGDGLDVEAVTRITLETRKKIFEVLEVFRRDLPGFENAYVLDTGTQIGVRETRKLVGRYILTRDDILQKRQFEDVIIHGLFDIPYRCLLPQHIEGLLAAGRCISVSHEAHGNIRNIPPCLATGQAAGTAAALAVRAGMSPGDLDVLHLQQTLLADGFYLGSTERLKALTL